MQRLLGLKHRDGVTPNVLALIYILSAYCGGFYLLIQYRLRLFPCAVILISHAIVIAAYLIHECAHNTLFISNQRNAQLGKFLSWLIGACYCDYRTIRDQHFRHHIERADITALDLKPLLLNRPRLLRLIFALEWCYFPAIDWLMHITTAFSPFMLESRRKFRRQVIQMLILRGSIFLFVLIYFPAAAIGYLLAYTVALHILRFMDAFQHTFALSSPASTMHSMQKNNRDYEQSNTFSNPLSLRHPWLNLLVLNFCYHNAHHSRPSEPWHRLPSIHRELFGENNFHTIPFENQLRAYHHFRVQRILNQDQPGFDVMASQGADFVGVVGASFLTAF